MATRGENSRSRYSKQITTPRTITPVIKTWVQRIAPGSKLIFVDLIPNELGRPHCCYSNCRQFMTIFGDRLTDGTMAIVHGWIIWTIASQWLETERHAVIGVGANGKYMYRDPTPQADGEKRILFAIDHNAIGNANTKHINPLVNNEITRELQRLALHDHMLREQMAKEVKTTNE